MATTKIFGGPGTGKTTVLIEGAKQALLESDLRIYYETYSKAMAKEARERSGLPGRTEDGKMAGTLHSIYSQLLGYTKEDYLDRKSVYKFFDNYGIQITMGDVWTEDDLVMITGGALSLGGKIASEFDAHQQAYRPLMPVDDYDGDIHSLYESYQEMKGHRKDYTDILVDAKEQRISPEADLLLVDEFQDLTALMYDIVLEAEKDAERTMIGGDPNQTIFGFRGCDASLFLNHLGEEKILPWSYRCTREILDSGESVLSEIPKSERKEMKIDGERGGEVFEGGDVEMAIEEELGHEGACYILARTNRMAWRVGTILQGKGIAYGAINPNHWNAITPWMEKVKRVNNALACYSVDSEPSPDDKKELILSLPAKLLRRGTKTLVKKGEFDLENRPLKSLFSKKITAQTLIPLLDIPDRAQRAIGARGIMPLENFKFFVDTKHASKGKEADAVISLQDVPRVIQDAIDLDPRAVDEECRLEYVARTRARRRLHLVNLKGWL